MSSAPIRVLLVGAGHGHLKTINAIPELTENNAAVTVVDPGHALFYSGAMSGVIGGFLDESAAVIDTADLVERRGGVFHAESATVIDPKEKTLTLSDGRVLEWDILSCAIGSRSRLPFQIDEDVTSQILPLKPMHEITTFFKAIDRYRTDTDHPVITIIGGGASAVEIAGNLECYLRRHQNACSLQLITKDATLLPMFPPQAGRIALDSLRSRGVCVEFKREIVTIDSNKITFSDGSSGKYGLLVPATGLVVPSLFYNSSLPVGAAGGLSVDETLRVPGEPIFGVGDCISFQSQPLAKIGVHAVYQGPIVLENIRKTIFAIVDGDSRQLDYEIYRPPRSTLQILALGDGTALAIRNRSVLRGRWLRLLKERIDWQYVRTEGRRIDPSLWSAPPTPPVKYLQKC